MPPAFCLINSNSQLQTQLGCHLLQEALHDYKIGHYLINIFPPSLPGEVTFLWSYNCSPQKQLCEATPVYCKDQFLGSLLP